jgi:hypothetical protein
MNWNFILKSQLLVAGLTMAATNLTQFSGQMIYDSGESNPHTIGCFMIPSSLVPLELGAEHCIESCKSQKKSGCIAWAFQQNYEGFGHSRCCMYKNAPSTNKQGPYADFVHRFVPGRKEVLAGVIVDDRPKECPAEQDLFECYAWQKYWPGRKVIVPENQESQIWTAKGITSAKECRNACILSGFVGTSALCRLWTFNAATKVCQHSDEYAYTPEAQTAIDITMQGLVEAKTSPNEVVYTGVFMHSGQTIRDIPCDNSKTITQCILENHPF